MNHQSHTTVTIPRRLVSLVLAVALSLSAGLPALPALAAAPQAKLDSEVLKRIGQPAAISVIVVYSKDPGILLAELRRSGIRGAYQVPLIHAVAASLQPAWIHQLMEDPYVLRIVFDAPVHIKDTAYNPAALATVYPYVDDAVAVWSNPASPLTGKGIGVAVLDSGIAAHPDLGGRVIVNMNFNPNVADANDASGHGTEVAGIVGGNGSASSGAYIGVAPEVNILNLRVSDATGASSSSVILNAVLWAVANQATYNIRVINLSLVSSVAESYHTSALDAAVEFAWLKGIVVVVAAGNSGPNSAIYAPANDPYVITVGATDDLGTQSPADDGLVSWSSYGVTQDGYSKPDMVAPGRHIIGPLASTTSAIAQQFPSWVVNSQYLMLSGTSVAAPQVAGIAALYLEAQPTSRPGQVKALLATTANGFGGGLVPPLGAGAGYADAQRAISYTGLVGNANHGIVPNDFLQVLYMTSNNLTTTSTVSWDSVSWDSVSWGSVSWDSTTFSAVSWVS